MEVRWIAIKTFKRGSSSPLDVIKLSRPPNSFLCMQTSCEKYLKRYHCFPCFASRSLQSVLPRPINLILRKVTGKEWCLPFANCAKRFKILDIFLNVFECSLAIVLRSQLFFSSEFPINGKKIPFVWSSFLLVSYALLSSQFWNIDFFKTCFQTLVFNRSLFLNAW